jgi:hypothetical protein
VALGLTAGFPAAALAPAAAVSKTRSAMTHKVRGSFEVKLTPEGLEDKAEGSTLGRLSTDKQFHGDLDAISKGQMLTGMTDVPGSAGYVAIERVTGVLEGRRGSFVLQHTGTMSKADGYQLSVMVVPDSGSGQLVGLRGKLDIQIVEGKHLYEFEYTLPDIP